MCILKTVNTELKEWYTKVDKEVTTLLNKQEREGKKKIEKVRKGIMERAKWDREIMLYEIPQLDKMVAYLEKYKWLSPNQKSWLRYWSLPLGSARFHIPRELLQNSRLASGRS